MIISRLCQNFKIEFGKGKRKIGNGKLVRKCWENKSKIGAKFEQVIRGAMIGDAIMDGDQ